MTDHKLSQNKKSNTKKRISTMIIEKHCSEVCHLKVIGVDIKKDKNALSYILGYDHYSKPIINRTDKDKQHLTFTAEWTFF
jgi:hypothetical protein